MAGVVEAACDETRMTVECARVEGFGVGPYAVAQRQVRGLAFEIEGVTTRQHEVEAFAGQLMRQGPTNSRSGPDDQRGFSHAGPTSPTRRASEEAKRWPGSTSAQTRSKASAWGYISRNPSGPRHESLAR